MHIANCRTNALMNATRICLIVVTLLAGNGLAPRVWGQSEPAPASPSDGLKDSEGLKGLLPADPPASLTDTLERFPGTWETWTSSLAGELNALYGETPNEIAGQRAALARLKTRLETINKALANAQYNPIRNDLLELRGGLIRHCDLFEAVLDTLTDRETGTYTNSTSQRLLTSLDTLDAYLDGAIGGSDWKTYLQTAQVRSDLASGTNNTPSFDGLKTSLKKLEIARRSNDSVVRECCERPPFKNYFLDLYRAVAAFEIQTTGIKWSDIKSEMKTLLGELQKYEATKLLGSANQVRTTFDRLRQLAPKGAERLTGVMRQHYFNSNFQASISEGFLNRLMSTSRVESGGVRDYILGADVYGSQTTASQSTINLVPANPGAHLQIQLSGDVSSNTEAYASRAVITNVGSNHFDGFKDVFFNGTSFSTSPAIVNASASNQAVGASTKADGIPIFAGIARRMALRGADRNRPEAEAISAQRVDSRVSPRFNEEVDSAFARLNVELQNKVTLPLRSEQLYPDYIASMSTDSELTMNTRLMSQGKLGGGAAPVELPGPDDVLFSFHESLLNNSLDLLPIAGKSMTEVELEQIVNQSIAKFFPKLNLVKTSSPKSEIEAGEPKRIMFAENDPLRVRFEDGNILLMIRAGFERDAERGGNIPPQIVTIPLAVSVAGNEIVMTRGDILVESLTNKKVAQQVVLAGVIKSRLTKSFPDTSKSASKFNIEREGKAPLSLRITGMTMQNGWLSVRAAPEPIAQVF
jgi:hypothetical protein